MGAVFTHQDEIMMQCRRRNHQIEVRDRLSEFPEPHRFLPEQSGDLVREGKHVHKPEKSFERGTGAHWIG